MPERPPIEVGDVCWLEIPATDMGRCQAFYKSVFGWEFAAPPGMPGSEGYYSIFTKPGTKLMGGIWVVPEEELIKPKVLSEGKAQASNRITMKVEEVTAGLQSIEAAGGSIICKKTLIGPDMGYYGTFRDTEGNTNGLWSKD